MNRTKTIDTRKRRRAWLIIAVLLTTFWGSIFWGGYIFLHETNETNSPDESASVSVALSGACDVVE